jgi:hypothetical protein
MTGQIYRPPFAPYSERQEANDTNPLLRIPWDGCATWTDARALDGTTGGKVHNLTEDDIRAACGNPDVPGTNGITLDQQALAFSKLAPVGTWYSPRPTQAEFLACLAAGGIAVMAGWESDAPLADRAYDPAFYDNVGHNGHNVFVQGVGDGKNVIWGNPEMFLSTIEPVVPIAAALKFVWDSLVTGYPRVEAILFNSVRVAQGADMDLTKASPVALCDLTAGGTAYVAPGNDTIVGPNPNIAATGVPYFGAQTRADGAAGGWVRLPQGGAWVGANHIVNIRSTLPAPAAAPADRAYLVHLNVPGDVNVAPSITKA